MNKWLVVLLNLILAQGIALADPILGRWFILDDHTGKKIATVILERDHDKVSGRIAKLDATTAQPVTCELCTGAFRDQPLIGMKFIWDLTMQKNGVCGGGHMLDFKTGKVYRARLKEVKQQLYVRQYVGTPYLGHTHIWVR